MTLTRTLPLLAGAALIAAGCGSSSSTSGDVTPSESPGGTPIAMKNIQFEPRSKTVKVGEKITWTNDDDVDHNVTSVSGPDSFKSSDFGQGKTFSYTPKTAGKIAYTCTLHPGMDAALTVVK